MRRESYLRTADFRDLARKYYKHCGPTAITNLICTLRPDLVCQAPQVFAEVAALGKKMLVYWNIRATKHLGGTNDMLAGAYIKQALGLFGLGEAMVHFGGAANAGRVRKALDEGKIVYLEMHFHPKYHNHHLLIYGFDWQGFRAADGWRHAPVYLAERDLRKCLYFTIAL